MSEKEKNPPLRPFGIIISAPSGTGKTTIIKNISERLDNIYSSISSTTRKPREGEKDGKDYYFISKNDFNELLGEDGFLEHDIIYDNFYGTSKSEIEKSLKLNKNIIFDISWAGAKKIINNLDSISIYLIPPSLSELRNRLLARNKDNHEVINKRLNMVKDEVKQANNYNYIIINKDIEQTTELILKIIEIEKAKRQRYDELIENLTMDSIN